MNTVKINFFTIFLIIGFVALLSRSFYLTLGEKWFDPALNKDESPVTTPNPTHTLTPPSSQANAQSSNEADGTAIQLLAHTSAQGENSAENQAEANVSNIASGHGNPSRADSNASRLASDSRNSPTKDASNIKRAKKLKNSKNPKNAKRPLNYALLPSTQRGSIVDQHGFPLAYSEYLYNLYLDGRVKIPLNDSSVERIAQLIGIHPKKIYDNLHKDRVILLKRFAEKDKAKWLYSLKTPHFLTDRVLHRTYPEKTLLAQTLGFVGHDERGLSGLEQYYEKELSAYIGTETGQEVRLELTIDKHLQRNIAARLKETVIRKQAQAGIIIVQDVTTRNLRALSIYPTFNLNHFTQVDVSAFRNKAISYIIEPGSIFKVLFSAYLLEHQQDLAIDEKRYFCKGFYELKNGEIINCTGKHGAVSLSDIISYSCNAGMIQAAEHLSKREIRQFLTTLGIGRPTGIDLPGEEKGILPTLKEWGQRTTATSLIGQGIGVTPLQLINAFTTVVSDGTLRQPKLVNTFQYYQDHTPLRETKHAQSPKTRVLQETTTAKIRQLLQNGVRSDSTGSAAKQGGYLKILGKTSTSQVANNRTGGYYAHKYHSIFAGAYPETNPQFTVLVLIMLPEKEYHGGRTAAPLFAEILDDIIRSYHLDDERTYETVTLPASKSPATLLAQTSPSQPPQQNTLHTTTQYPNELTSDSYTAENTIDNTLTPASKPNSLNKSRPLSPNNTGIHALFAGTAHIPNFSTRQIPSFKGMSMRTALRIMDKLILENAQRDYHISYQLSGSGYITRQDPPAYTGIRGDTVIKLFLKH